jgi:hypothetical protein
MTPSAATPEGEPRATKATTGTVRDEIASAHEEAPKRKRLATAPRASTLPSDAIARAMARVEKTVGAHFPEALDSVKASLGVAAISCFSDQTHPMALIFVATPGAGKSTQLGFLMPIGDDDPLNAYFYRCDDFTPKSFVSHRADRNEKQLMKIDLLPQLRDKVLITKELAPLFKGKREEIVENFARLTAVLDGEGLVTNSGAHGRRGYTGRYVFQWLGAVARPSLTAELLAVIAELGPRMLFYDGDRPLNTTAGLVKLGQTAASDQGQQQCRDAVRAFVTTLYQRVPPRSTTTDTITVSEAQLTLIALWAQVLARLRTTLLVDTSGTFEIAPEHCERIFWLLRSLALGGALAHGRNAVNDYDLAQVAHTALSSGIHGRARALRAVLECGGSATTPEITAHGGGTPPTARQYMDQLALVGLATFTDGDSTEPATVTLAPAADADFGQLIGVPMLKAKRGEGEGPC